LIDEVKIHILPFVARFYALPLPFLERNERDIKMLLHSSYSEITDGPYHPKKLFPVWAPNLQQNDYAVNI
jgi:hypothetical protein